MSGSRRSRCSRCDGTGAASAPGDSPGPAVTGKSLAPGAGAQGATCTVILSEEALAHMIEQVVDRVLTNHQVTT